LFADARTFTTRLGVAVFALAVRRVSCAITVVVGPVADLAGVRIDGTGGVVTILIVVDIAGRGLAAALRDVGIPESIAVIVFVKFLSVLCFFVDFSVTVVVDVVADLFATVGLLTRTTIGGIHRRRIGVDFGVGLLEPGIGVSR
jgi:hypothetical protein